MNVQVTGLGLHRMKPGGFADPEEAEEADDQQLLEPGAWRTRVERRTLLREFLTSGSSPHLLKRHHARMELLKKCSYYVEILPKQLALGDQSPLALPNAVLQLVHPWKFQRMKKLVKQRLADLSGIMDSFRAVPVPGCLHIKHRLVSDASAAKTPHSRLLLGTKMPVLFDRTESAAHQDWASLRWFGTAQPALLEQYELRFRLLEPRTQQECLQGGGIPVAACYHDVCNLLPQRRYKFTIKRAESYTLVYEPWRDSLTLQTKPGPPEGARPPPAGQAWPAPKCTF